MTKNAYGCILFTVTSSFVLLDVQMLTDEEKTQAQQLQKANPDMIYLNDVNILVSHTYCPSLSTLCVSNIFYCCQFN